MLPVDPEQVVARLKDLQRAVRDLIVRSRDAHGLHHVTRTSSSDTIYALDAAVDPVIEEFCREWSRTTPLVLVAEGLEDPSGRECAKTFPEGARESDVLIRVIIDPIDGTRGLMYDKRSAWTLAGVAPNKGPGTRLRDIEVAVMSELPTSKMGQADVLWAIKGHGAHGERCDLINKCTCPLYFKPSDARDLEHGFASVSSFFPGTKVIAARLVEQLARGLVQKSELSQVAIFDDQYISTGGQWYELIAGHDRFNADLRPHFYKAMNIDTGFCCHPYDCAALLIAEQAGVIITDVEGIPLDASLDTTSAVSWVGYANAGLRDRIEPLLKDFVRHIDARTAD